MLILFNNLTKTNAGYNEHEIENLFLGQTDTKKCLIKNEEVFQFESNH